MKTENASQGQWRTGVTVLRALGFLGVIASVSGCAKDAYMPSCAVACTVTVSGVQ